jgi:enamine deaminase RidA (YjgF/YER057c/UK114 family)
MASNSRPSRVEESIVSERKFISSGSSFEKVVGYSRAVVDGDWIFVSGTTGYDYSTMTMPQDLEGQTRQAFRNISTALEQAGATLDDVVRVHYYLADGAYFKQAASLFGEYLGTGRPAATAIVCGLVEPQMKIEIEVTARRRGASVVARGTQQAYPPGRS